MPSASCMRAARVVAARIASDLRETHPETRGESHGPVVDDDCLLRLLMWASLSLSLHLLSHALPDAAAAAADDAAMVLVLAAAAAAVDGTRLSLSVSSMPCLVC